MSPSTIYNATDGPLAIDRAGRMLGARDRDTVDDVTGSPLAGHITAERIVVLDQHDDSDDVADTSPADDAEATPSTSPRTRKGRASTSPQEA